MMNISRCKLIELPKIQDSRGNLTFAERDFIVSDLRYVNLECFLND